MDRTSTQRPSDATRNLSTITSGDTMICTGFDTIAPHEAAPADFTKGKTRCRACTSVYFKAWAAKKRGKTVATPVPTCHTTRWINSSGKCEHVDHDPAAAQVATVITMPDDIEAAVEERDYQHSVEAVGAVDTMERSLVHHEERAIGHTYRPDPRLVTLWTAIVKAGERGDHIVLAMHGPRGSGKTDAAQHLASLADRPLVKIDAKSVVDAEAWFGTRGASNGSTFYQPSEFAMALQQRCVIFIDEYTRVSNDVRDVLNPFMDGTRSVLNPITGDRIKMHPECIVILAGNVGFKYTGVYDVDPATTSRLAVFNVDYPDADNERAILVEHAKIDEDVAMRLVNLAVETRANPNLPSVSTRELLHAAVLIANGLDEDAAVDAKIIAPASDQGDEGSNRAKLTTLWNGHRASAKTVDAEESTGDFKVCSCGDLAARFTACSSCGAWVA